MLDLTALKTLADVICVSQDIREESFVANGFLGEYAVCKYDSSVRAAVRVLNLHKDHTTVEAVAAIVYLLNTLAWNDIQAWAADVRRAVQEAEQLDKQRLKTAVVDVEEDVIRQDERKQLIKLRVKHHKLQDKYDALVDSIKTLATQAGLIEDPDNDEDDI